MCACVRARVRSADEGPGPRGGREAADSTLWMTLGCRPGTVFCSSAFLLGWGPSYYAIFQELLDPAFFFFLLLQLSSASAGTWAWAWAWPQGQLQPCRGRPLEEAKFPFQPALPPPSLAPGVSGNP